MTQVPLVPRWHRADQGYSQWQQLFCVRRPVIARNQYLIIVLYGIAEMHATSSQHRSDIHRKVDNSGAREWQTLPLWFAVNIMDISKNYLCHLRYLTVNECENEANYLLTKLSSIATPEAVFDNFGAFSDKNFTKISTKWRHFRFSEFMFHLYMNHFRSLIPHVLISCSSVDQFRHIFFNHLRNCQFLKNSMRKGVGAKNWMTSSLLSFRCGYLSMP